jgi:hypothetical protein
LPAAMDEDEISRNQGKKKKVFESDQTSAQEIFHPVDHKIFFFFKH